MLKKNTLGTTGLKVSAIGLGTVKFGRNEAVHYPEKFSLPSDADILELLVSAKKLGINLLDTAPAYGVSEERLGKLLVGQREEWIISTKVGEEFSNGQSHFDFSPAHIRKSIARSLERLQTTYLDIVLVHSNGEDKKIIEIDGALDTLAALKKEGVIRAFGMSTKTVEGGILAVELSDVVMVTFNPIQIEDRPVITLAQQQNKGIFIKKALASGHLQKISTQNPVRESLQFIFQEPAVSSVIVGTLSAEHLRENVNAAIGGHLA